MKKVIYFLFLITFSFSAHAFFCMQDDGVFCNSYAGKDGCRLAKQGTTNCPGTSCECITAIPGYYLSKMGKPVVCPAGYYCSGGTTDKVACSKGTYNSKTKQGGSSGCTICTGKAYTDQEASTSAKQCGTGQTGYKVKATDLGNTGCKTEALLDCSKFNPDHGKCTTCTVKKCSEIECDTGYEPNYLTNTCESSSTVKKCKLPFVLDATSKCCTAPTSLSVGE